MADVFFRASYDALENITTAFDFVHPLNVSLRYTRDKVAKAKKDNPKIKDADLKNIIDPNNLVHGVNYTKAFIETLWDTQEELLSWLLLNNLFAIHEGWAQRMYDDVFSCGKYDKRTFLKNLEYENLYGKLSSYFVKKNDMSNALESAFFQVYKAKSGLDFSKLDNYMLCYRFFKEARNCYMHHNFVASPNLISAYQKFLPVATTKDLDVSEVPAYVAPILGQRVQLQLRGVIGFSQLIRRIIIISDICLLRAKAAEKEFIDRIPFNWNCWTLSGDNATAKGQVNRYATKVGFLKSQWSNEYQDFLIKHGILHK